MARRSFLAVSLFWNWERPSSHRTVVFVGIWVTTTAVSTLFRCWPPFPDPFVVTISRSLSKSVNSWTVGSFKTAMVMVLVWTLPYFSVGGTRCQRWPPASLEKSEVFLPVIWRTARPDLKETIEYSKWPPACQPRVNIYLFGNQILGVRSTFSCSDFYNHNVILSQNNYIVKCEEYSFSAISETFWTMCSLLQAYNPALEKLVNSKTQQFLIDFFFFSVLQSCGIVSN